ncbi:hypothetical protein [Croceicoccus gelatinilyticus]|uniref:hypothetical protein n=1 Tax=Croceicoccus gelatinilyticus TaxID=2835536 RepID=UPI001BCE7146|nr:hypothetical protein [Croceicoccus gelatinilyticus]
MTKFDESVEVIWVEPAASGEFCRRSAASAWPFLMPSSGEMIWIGSGLLNSVRRRREPTTTMAPSSSAACGVVTSRISS